jgi:hypothetical protein
MATGWLAEGAFAAEAAGAMFGMAKALAEMVRARVRARTGVRVLWGFRIILISPW